MKKTFVILLAIVAVFSMMVGCSVNEGSNVQVNDTRDMHDTEHGENAETNEDADEDDNPHYVIVSPITDGGSYSGDGYND